MILNPRQKYLQIAFNRSMNEVLKMMRQLPATDRILIEAGTPFIKQYGTIGLARLVHLWQSLNNGQGYVVADLKCMDRGFTEVSAVKNAGASAATCLGLAPIETLDAFIKTCADLEIDSMIDMLNVPFPFEVIQQLKKRPDIVVLHRGVDESLNSTKAIPYHDITRLKGSYNIVISIAGGETLRDAQRAFFNSADIAIVWKEFYENPDNVKELAEKFLTSIKGYGHN